MRIDVAKIPPEGYTQEEDFRASDLELDFDAVVFESPVHVAASISRVTNAVHVDVTATAAMQYTCGRCLKEFRGGLSKEFGLDYVLDKNQQFIDMDPDVREEIILDFPMKLVCKTDCKGLCPSCGADLNEGKCNC